MTFGFLVGSKNFCKLCCVSSCRLLSALLWQTQWRVLLLRHRQRHEDSRAFSKLDKFQSERARWHDWAAALQSYISNVNADKHKEMTAFEGKTAVTPNVSVARCKSLHFMLTMLVARPALDIILNSGQGEGYESWRRLVLECKEYISNYRKMATETVYLQHEQQHER